MPAVPRFAPTGARATPGFTPVGTAPPPRAVQPSAAPGVAAPGVARGPVAQAAIQAGIPRGGGGVLTQPSGRFFTPGQDSWAPRTVEGSQDVMGRIGKDYSRPSTLLGQLFRTLRLGENVGVGIAKGVAEGVSNALHFQQPGLGTTSKDILELLPPWAFYSQMPREIGKSLRDDMTYEEWIKEANDPDSFLFT